MSKASKIRVAVVLSDLHCGSTYGLLPPDFETLEGNKVEQNAVQKWLWTCWKDATEKWLPKLIGTDEFALIVNGDATEGIHHHSTEIISPELGDHLEAATITLKPLAEWASERFVTEGTEVHTKNIEHALAKSIKAKRDPDTTKAAWPRLVLTIAGCRCVFQHHITTTSRPYLEASALSIHLGVEQLEAAKNGEPLPQVLCCAHRHRYGEFRDASGLCLVTPPWQLLTRFARKVVPSARTRPGIVVLDWRERDDGELPETSSITYRPPTATGVTL
jgi:hypothetical protein